MTVWSLVLVLASGLRTLVLPFENLSDDRSQDWKGSALEEAVGSHLESAGLDVIELGARNHELLEKGLNLGGPITRASAIVLAKDLGADWLVLGEFRLVEGRIEVTARLIDLNRGATLGVVDDFAESEKFARLTNQIAKNLFRLERDGPPPSYDAEAERRLKIPLAALEAAALARTESDVVQQKALLSKALSSHPDYLEVRLLLGDRLLEEGLPREATEVLAAVRGRGRLYERAYFDLGLAYLDASEPQLAFEVFRNLVERDGTNAAFHNNLGVALMRLDRIPEAIEMFDRAHELGPDQRTCLFNLAWAQWRAGKGAIAFELFENLASQDPIDPEAHFVLAEAAVSQARPAVAERSRASALVLAPYLEGVDVRTVSNWERTLDDSAAGKPGSEISWLDASIRD